MRARVCALARACLCADIVSMDRISRFTNTLITIVNGTSLSQISVDCLCHLANKISLYGSLIVKLNISLFIIRSFLCKFSRHMSVMFPSD